MYTYDLKNAAVVEDAANAAMPKHLADRLAGLSKNRPSKDEIEADMKRAAGNREAFIESKVSKAATFALRAKKVKEVHDEYASNFTMLPANSTSKREYASCLPTEGKQGTPNSYKLNLRTNAYNLPTLISFAATAPRQEGAATSREGVQVA